LVVSFIKDRALLKTTLLIKPDQKKRLQHQQFTLWGCAVCTFVRCFRERYCNTTQPLNDQVYETFVVGLCESSKISGIETELG